MEASAIKAMMAEIAPVIREYVASETGPLIQRNAALEAENKALAARIEALEARELPEAIKGDPGRDGADCDMEAVERMIAERIEALPPAERGEPGAPGRDGESVDMDAVKGMVAKAVAELPAPKDGLPGKDGADVDMGEVKRLVAEEVVAAVSVLPPAEKGEPGKDGLGLANALIDRDGSLVITFSDGSDKNLGLVVGKDGEPGRDGKDGHTFTLDDFDIEPIDERTIKMGFTHGEVKHSFELAIPALIYRGVWREGETYDRGDMTTWAGGVWHCDKDGCTGKPDSGDWTLAVKRGRDGKDARP